MSAFQRFLTDFAMDTNTSSTESQGFEDSQDDYEYIQSSQIRFPKMDETQIMDNENDSREVVLYLKTKNGRVDGAECTPFILPQRWTYPTLFDCVKHYIRRQVSDSADIAQLYYKKNRGKAVVKLNNDGDINSLLKEYPLTYSSGKRKVSTMYLAVDLKDQNQLTPRRSPRLRERPSYDVYVYELSPDIKVLGHADVLHKVSADASLEDITVLLKTYDDEKKLYNPSQGLFWLRKGTKQLVSLKSPEDLQACKTEYKGNLRIACRTVNVQSGNPMTIGNNRKRKLDMGTGKDSDNELWNATHVALVRDLEKRGNLWRYGSKHLKLWTDQIINGNSSGANDEPSWEEYIDVVMAPPKSKKSQPVTPKSSPAAGFPTSTNNLMEMMFLQQQQRSELIQTALLASLSNSQNFQMPGNLSPLTQKPAVPKPKGIHHLTTEDCLDILRSIGLQHHSSMFTNNKVDGPMLEALIHPHLGQQLMLSLGVNDPSDRHRLITELFRIKGEGYKNSTTSTSS